MADLRIPGTDGDTVETVPLGNRGLLSQLSEGGISARVRFNNNPEFVCFVICRTILKDECTYFTYDGLDADRCGPRGRVPPFTSVPAVLPIHGVPECIRGMSRRERGKVGLDARVARCLAACCVRAGLRRACGAAPTDLPRLTLGHPSGLRMTAEKSEQHGLCACLQADVCS